MSKKSQKKTVQKRKEEENGMRVLVLIGLALVVLAVIISQIF